MLPSRQATLRAGVIAAAFALSSSTAGAAIADDSSGRVAVPLSSAVAPASADACQVLLDEFIERNVDSVGPWGWSFGIGRDDLDSGFAVPLSGNTAHDAQSSSGTGTNVQEDGVDEPDVAKTDGTLLVRVDHRNLTTYDVSGEQVRKLGSLQLPGRLAGSELLLSGDRALVLASAYGRKGVTRTRVLSVDLSTPAAPRVVDVRAYEGELVSARLTDSDVRLVTSTGLPRLGFVHPTKKRTVKQARKQNKQIVRRSTLEDWLPTLRTSGGNHQLLDCDDVLLPEDGDSAGVMSVIGFPATAPGQIATTALATGSQIAYSSGDRLYLATGRFRGGCCIPLDVAVNARFAPEIDNSTELHAFALDGTTATHVASGKVEGRIADRWAMDSVDGVLRVAVATTEKKPKKGWKDANAVVTLGERDGALVELDRVDDLGVNEDIQSVRWFDDLAIVVTFRQIDPLYAIDVSNPEALKLLGELKITGFSSYLHPIGDQRLLGLGTDATKRGRVLGKQAATFDIANPATPTQLDKVTWGKRTELQVAWEPRQFTWLDDADTALTVMMRHGKKSKVAVAALTVAPDGSLTKKMLPVKGSWKVAASLRTLPLPDGRVVATDVKRTAFLDW